MIWHKRKALKPDSSPKGAKAYQTGASRRVRFTGHLRSVGPPHLAPREPACHAHEYAAVLQTAPKPIIRESQHVVLGCYAVTPSGFKA